MSSMLRIPFAFAPLLVAEHLLNEGRECWRIVERPIEGLDQ